MLLHVGQGAVVGGERGVTLGREREIERRFREGQEALRHADEMDGVLRGDRDGERARVRQSDIFRRQDDEAPRHEERVLAGLQHAGEPVERRVRIRAAQRLDERGNGVVVRVAGLVMGQAPLHDLLDECGRDRLLPARREDRGFEGAQGAARVAAGLHDDGVQRVRFNGRATPAQSPLAVVERALDESAKQVRRQRLERVDAGPREQRADHFEGRILGRRADQGDGAVFHVRQDHVLLRLVEAVDLVDEEDGPLPLPFPADAGVRDELAQLGDAGRDCGEGREVGVAALGDEARQRRLAAARRSPEDQRGDVVGVDRTPQRALRSDEVLLPDELVEGARTHARCERGAGIDHVGGVEERGAGRRTLARGDGSASLVLVDRSLS